MKSIIYVITAMLTFVSMAQAEQQFQVLPPDFRIENRYFGSGDPAGTDVDNSMKGDKQFDKMFYTDGIFHTPQYLPNYPTAATIWPRVVEVPCEEVSKDRIVCDGYEWTPDLGRAEYLMFRPKHIKPARVIYVEVPPKKKSQ